MCSSDLRIDNGEGAPRTLQPEEARQAPYQRDDQQKLTQHREAKRGDPPSDPLVEPGEKDLEAGEHDAERDEPSARDALGDQLWVVGEDGEEPVGKQEQDAGAQTAYSRRGQGRQLEGLPHAPEVPGPLVVADDGHHPLVHSEDRHHDQGVGALDDAVRRHPRIPSVPREGVEIGRAHV